MNGCFGADAKTTFRVHAYLCYERVIVVLMLMLMAFILSTLANLL
ncbi:hypothetical protein Hanom_Chr06g00505031 [Helianthus anomalus]